MHIVDICGAERWRGRRRTARRRRCGARNRSGRRVLLSVGFSYQLGSAASWAQLSVAAGSRSWESGLIARAAAGADGAARGDGGGGGAGAAGAGEKDAKLALKLGQLQPFITVFPQERMGQLASCGPT